MTKDSTDNDEKKNELKALAFITIFLFPILSIIGVGGYGFIIWMLQIIFGPPGHGL
ncbi:nitrate reductase NapE [Sinobacterium caligoides]|uniref:Nitrate reductase NapE n=1 Tax=Sinobacterium caligoides TaxID=933926 RepID=A0A3N2DY68_9GAMM|nr:nitrate reductase NapE [Sinobacterium caligoides]